MSWLRTTEPLHPCHCQGRKFYVIVSVVYTTRHPDIYWKLVLVDIVHKAACIHILSGHGRVARRTHHISPPPATQGHMECAQAWHTFEWLPRGSGVLCDGRVGRVGRKLGRLLIDPLFVSSTHHQLPLSSPPTIMSAGPSTSTSNSNFVSIFNAALKAYQRKTKKDLTSHPLLPRLQICDSPEVILTVLREQIPAFNQSQNGDDRLTKWVSPTVNVLCAFSATVGQGVGLVCIGIFSWRIYSLTYTFRHSHPQMQSLRGSVFFSWSVSFMCRSHKLF
jgi:hypothetical protein